MLRRHAITSLLAIGIDRYFGGAHGAAVLVDRKTRRLIAAHAPELAGGSTAPPDPR